MDEGGERWSPIQERQQQRVVGRRHSIGYTIERTLSKVVFHDWTLGDRPPMPSEKRVRGGVHFDRERRVMLREYPHLRATLEFTSRELNERYEEMSPACQYHFSCDVVVAFRRRHLEAQHVDNE
mgnify:CR=1 FL=1